MKTWLTWVAAAVLSAGSAPPAPDATLVSRIPAIEHELSDITGLQFTKPVRVRILNREQLRAYLVKEVHHNVSAKELRGEEATLKLLGLVPADFSLEKATVDLFTEQAAAFYDYNRKALYLLAGDTDLSGPVALAHELAHALADQNFRLDKYVNRTGSDDSAMARLAVMEGQASWLMAAWSAHTSGRSVEDVLEMFEPDAAGSKPEQYPVYANAPLYMRESLVFPYSAGMKFEEALYKHDRQTAFRQPFVHPPAGTQQIIHPERYLRGDPVAAPPKPPSPPGRREYKLLTAGTLGEFDIRVILEQFATVREAQELAPHVAAAACATWQNRKSGRPALAWSVTWDDADSAERFFDFYRDVLGRKAGAAHIDVENADSLTGENADGRFQVERSGLSMTALEGLSARVQ